MENPPADAAKFTFHGPFTGKSTLCMVARVSAFTFGLVYGNMKYKYLKAKAKSHQKAEAKAHH